MTHTLMHSEAYSCPFELIMTQALNGPHTFWLQICYSFSTLAYKFVESHLLQQAPPEEKL